MMVDAFQPEGVTRLAVDSIFMMPQLGVLATIHPEAARNVFFKDCLVPLGTCIAPVGTAKPGKELCRIQIDGELGDFTLAGGTVKLIPLEAGKKKGMTIKPVRRMDVGAGPGKEWEGEVHGGVIGLILDGRGRPFQIPRDRKDAVNRIQEWNLALEIYPA